MRQFDRARGDHFLVFGRRPLEGRYGMTTVFADQMKHIYTVKRPPLSNRVGVAAQAETAS